MKFRDLKTGDTFNFINPNSTTNSFYKECKKISERMYVDTDWNRYKIGSIDCRVYNVNNEESFLFRLYDYDLWGNKKDGFEINGIFKRGVLIELFESDTKDEIIRGLKDLGYIKNHIIHSHILIECDELYREDYCVIYFYYIEFGHPIFELRREIKS